MPREQTYVSPVLTCRICNETSEDNLEFPFGDECEECAWSCVSCSDYIRCSTESELCDYCESESEECRQCGEHFENTAEEGCSNSRCDNYSEYWMARHGYIPKHLRPPCECIGAVACKHCMKNLKSVVSF